LRFRGKNERSIKAANDWNWSEDLARGLRPAIVVGTMIGTGIFLKPAEMAREGRFCLGGIRGVDRWRHSFPCFGALSFAELGAAIPEAGGEYAYLRRGFGPKWGFLFWMDAFHRGAAVFDGVHRRGDCAIREFP